MLNTYLECCHCSTIFFTAILYESRKVASQRSASEKCKRKGEGMRGRNKPREVTAEKILKTQIALTHQLQEKMRFATQIIQKRRMGSAKH